MIEDLLKNELISDIKKIQPNRDIEHEVKKMTNEDAVDYLIEQRQFCWQSEKEKGNPNFR